MLQKGRYMVSGVANLREEGVRIPPVRGKQRLASMESSVNFRAEKARKRLMPLAFRQWHLYRFDFMEHRNTIDAALLVWKLERKLIY